MKPLIIANWKMNLSLNEAINFIKKLDSQNYSNCLIIAPPVPFSAYLSACFTKLKFCAQDISVFKGTGPFTGEYSADMMKSCGVNYAIVGHSERRDYFGESNKATKKKAENCILAGIIPIICIGEPLEARHNNTYKEFLLKQIMESTPENHNGLIIAYEPLWAIGSGITPSIREIEEILDFLKTNKNTTIVAKNAQLVYGGSVTSANYKEILAIPNNSGVLVGSAALNEKELLTILN